MTALDRPAAPGGPRLSDADRDQAVNRLQQAFAQGRLGSGEMEQRLEMALTAPSQGDLDRALAGLPDDVLEIKSTGGRVKRTGEWRVPRLLRIDTEYGRVRLDLSRAVVEHSEIEIELRLAYGSATIILPPGASANADGTRTGWRGVTCTVPGRARPGKPHLRVTGELDYGRLRIRYPRLSYRAGR
jgi:hypothetical protein